MPRFPYAALILVVTAVATAVWTDLQTVLSVEQVQRIAVVALVVILFNGGLHIGRARFRRSLRPILTLGIVGTFVTAGVIALAAHSILGFSWIEAGLVGAAIAPTDPAVTFSIFTGREHPRALGDDPRGLCRSGSFGISLMIGTIELAGGTTDALSAKPASAKFGEAGMNDPVGIALMIGMIELAQEDDGTLWLVAREFAVEMVMGIAGALAVLPVLRRVRMTGVALYPIRVLAVAGAVYGLAAVAGGSGFLAVFVAGVVLGDAAMLRKGEIENFQSSVAVLAEIAVFIALGLTISEADLGLETWLDGLGLAVILAFVARPLAVLPLLLPERLSRGERLFIAWGGLKGASPSWPSARSLRLDRSPAVDGCLEPLRHRRRRGSALSRMHRSRARLRAFVDTVADIVVILVFITLGANCRGATSGTTSTGAARRSEPHLPGRTRRSCVATGGRGRGRDPAARGARAWLGRVASATAGREAIDGHRRARSGRSRARSTHSPKMWPRSSASWHG